MKHSLTEITGSLSLDRVRTGLSSGARVPGRTSSGGNGKLVFTGNAPCSTDLDIVLDWRRTIG